MTARVLVAYAASTGFTSRQAGAVASQIAEVSGLDVDVQPISYVPTVEPYVAVFLGWSGHSRAGRRETLRFLSRNAALLPDRRVWVVHHQPGVDGSHRPQGQGPVRLSRLLLRHGVVPTSYDPPTDDLDEATDSVEENPILLPARSMEPAQS
ncbi:MAG TPA: hypothetical protein VHV82_16305 [Sporichthyaceae bacterium]|jgi:hypothetical protein|nr:hypothetical protein [Sporichthyaceae bacterium]